MGLNHFFHLIVLLIFFLKTWLVVIVFLISQGLGYFI